MWPFSAFWRQKFAMEDADRVGFHTVAGIRLHREARLAA